MISRNEIHALLNDSLLISQKVTVMGWVRNFRNNQFIALNDGSSLNTLQIVLPSDSFSEDLIKKITVGSAWKFTGTLTASTGAGQKVEVIADTIELLGESDASKYPLQPKKHSLEFLREIGHLRMRTNTFSAIFRVRHAITFAIHQFFNTEGFFNIHTPIITASDAEGAGEMFHVTHFDLNAPPRAEDGSIDYKKDFFGRATNLTVSGQLEGELSALALGKIYTFGPTFRAENSNTSRHLAEFWMMEPEVAFADLENNMDLAERMLIYVIDYCMKNCGEDLAFLEDRLDKEEQTKPVAERSEMKLLEKLKFVAENAFQKLTYTEAVEILMASAHFKKGKFKYPVSWGTDLQSEHERYLVEKHFKKPVILINYPREIKAFYMRQNDDGKTVAAMDILFPGIGEIVGGSQREERLDKLLARMAEVGIPEHELWWFLETRKFGSVPHAGFGLGLERLVMFVTGMTNIRDVSAFPRFPGSSEF